MCFLPKSRENLVKGKVKNREFEKHKKRSNFPDCRFNNSTLVIEIWGQFNCRINCLNYFGLVSLIKSKHINFETKTTNPCPLISQILNSKSLSKEIYQQFMPSELDFDTIKGLSKWRSELETDIYFENIFSNISKITYDYKLQNFPYKLLHRILPTNTFLVKIGIKD